MVGVSNKLVNRIVIYFFINSFYLQRFQVYGVLHQRYGKFLVSLCKFISRMNQFIILLASNSEAEKNMTDARKRLHMAFLEGLHFSKNHWSEAVVKEGHTPLSEEISRYLNAVCVGQTDKTPEDVSSFLKQMEVEMGRLRGVEAQGRVAIDLDLVEWNGEILRPKDAVQGYYRVCLEDLHISSRNHTANLLL